MKIEDKLETIKVKYSKSIARSLFEFYLALSPEERKVIDHVIEIQKRKAS